LKQTGKLHSDVPIVLIGKNYWKGVINWQLMVELGTVSQDDVNEILFTDSVDEACEYIIRKLTAENTRAVPTTSANTTSTTSPPPNANNGGSPLIRSSPTPMET
jgi:hypothetical protein